MQMANNYNLSIFFSATAGRRNMPCLIKTIQSGPLSAFLLIIFVMFTPVSHAQQPQQIPSAYNTDIKINYIRTWIANAPELNGDNLLSRPLRDVRQTTQYYDGLGRPLQTVSKKGSLATGNSPVDMIEPVVYDNSGREQYKYLPSPSTASDATKDNGLFKLNPFQQQVGFYNSHLTG